jgi:exopolyphosphatase/guanosine-5'-triphosphate,3'-diphosphate pyrophosphatase
MIPTTRAVIDIGTNSTKLLVAEVAAGRLTSLYRASDVTCLGKDFFPSHRLTPESIETITLTIARLVSDALPFDPESIRIVATSAMRDAVNSIELISLVQVVTGLTLEIISGEQEAEWAYHGVASDPDLLGRPLAIFDLGGGSTEFVIGQHNIVHARCSYPLGSIRLFQHLKPCDPPSPAELIACRTTANRFVLEHIVPEMGPALRRLSHRGLVWVVCGGTAAALARVCRAEANSASEYVPSRLRYDALRHAVRRLWSLPRNERTNEGVPATRIDSILAGAVIIEATMQAFRVSQIAVSSHGMRHGALLSDTARRATVLPTFSLQHPIQPTAA